VDVFVHGLPPVHQRRTFDVVVALGHHLDGQPALAAVEWMVSSRSSSSALPSRANLRTAVPADVAGAQLCVIGRLGAGPTFTALC
jgi:hypothetical protein